MKKKKVVKQFYKAVLEWKTNHKNGERHKTRTLEKDR